LQRENIATGPNPGDSSLVSLPDEPSVTNQKRIMPKQVSLGAAWFPSSSLLLSADINYFSIKSVGDIVTLRSRQEELKDVLNIAVGTEYYVSKNLALRGGVYTDYANTPKISTGDVNQSEHIDIYGVTASVSHFTRNTAVTLGGGTTYGRGKSQIIGNSAAIQNASQQGWMLFLSSSYSY
jgi:long-chain fatty acid transport protein